jgi:protein SCO1/2
VKRSNVIIALVALAILTLAGASAWWNGGAPRAPPASDVGGPWRLTDENGARVDEGILKGKWSVVYFGYTFCPDVCPTTLAALAQAIDELGPRAKTLQVVFITVDPARDTPGQLRAYLSNPSFPRGMVGLTGSETNIKSAANEYHVYFSRQGAGADYSVDHTSILYLMDPQGRFVRPISSGRPPEMAGQLAAAFSGH